MSHIIYLTHKHYQNTRHHLPPNTKGLQEALDAICEQAAESLQTTYAGEGGAADEESCQLLILSDRLAGPDRLPIPSLLAVGAVHQHLLKTQQRPRVGLFVECGDAREVHDMATLLGYGADGICPYVAYEALTKMNAEGHVRARAQVEFRDEEVRAWLGIWLCCVVWLFGERVGWVVGFGLGVGRVCVDRCRHGMAGI